MGKTVNSIKQEIDIRRILKKYSKNWYLFGIALTIAVLWARNENRYIEPEYSLKTSVLIEDKSNSSVLQERGVISSSPSFLNTKLIENQISLLKSYAQIRKIIEQLDFKVSYFAKGKYIYTEIYKETPFTVDFDDTKWPSLYKTFNIRFESPTVFTLYSDEFLPLKTPAKYKTGEQISGEGYQFTINLKVTENKKYLEKDYAFQLNDLNGLTGRYMGKTKIYIERGTSMLVISSTGYNKQKEIDYLNQLTHEFLISNLEKKNKILTNTIQFIEQQLIEFGAELSDIEKEMEKFRKENQFMMLQEKIAGLLKNIDTESKEVKNLRIDVTYYEYLHNYILERDDLDDIVMPSSMGVSLPMWNAVAGEISNVIRQRDALLKNATPDNPYVKLLNAQIEEMKISMAESMRSTIETAKKKLLDAEDRLLALNDEFSNLPTLEREYLELERKYKMLLSLFDFLRKRKSEVEIQRASNTPDHEIVDYAGTAGTMNVSKSPKAAYINASIWAILLPSIFLFLLVFLNNRVMGMDDLTALSDIPIAGQISTNPHQFFDPVLKAPNSYFSELFRIIRIKLQLNPAQGKQIVAVTSTGIEDGKSFVALNLASVYALTGKKALLLSFDFRRPSIAEPMNLDSTLGITTHLMHDIPICQLIQKTFTKNLDILLPGPVPPNPDELIESEKTMGMIAELRKKYDYIVMDTPSIGLFGDAILLNKHSDATLFVVRHNFTRKKELQETIEEVKFNKLKDVWIAYNDAKIKIKDRNFSVYGEEAPKRFFILNWLLIARRILIDFLRKI